MVKIVVLGSGGWGIALALSAYDNGNSVTLWTPFQSEAEELTENRESAKFLSGIKIPDDISITTDISVTDGCDMAIIATPSFAVEETAKRLSEIKNLPLVVNVAKGLSKDCKRLSEVIEQYIKEMMSDTDDFVEFIAQAVDRSFDTYLYLIG